MISDVLSDAVAELDNYQQSLPSVYVPFQAEIDVVKTIMEALRIVLDSIPGLNEQHDKLLGELRAAIRDLQIYGIVGAVRRLMAAVLTERERLQKEEGL